MNLRFNLIVILAAFIIEISGYDYLNRRRFPKDFMFGVATSAYQIEGGYQADGKGESNWDNFVHTVPSPIFNNETGDVACDSYDKYEQDVKILKELGVSYYRFSISWTRILPTGDINEINKAGVNYYKNLIRELQNNDIEPFVTIFNWDTPQNFELIGGWTNENIINKYLAYANLCFESFGGDVKYWLTFNDPTVLCAGSYDYAFGGKWPGYKTPGIGPYLCAHNVVRAHAQVWRLYDQLYRPVYKGFVGTIVHGIWASPDSDSDADKKAADRLMDFYMGWFLNPLLKGSYPYEMTSFIDDRSLSQGFDESRLPVFTSQEIDEIQDAFDFIGINFNGTVKVKNVNDFNKLEISFKADSQLEVTSREFQADGIIKMLKWIDNNYGNISLVITADGYEDNGTLDDDKRIQYFQNNLSYIRDALDEGFNIFAYTIWSLMDSFEWSNGYESKMGIYSVNFEDADKPRKPKNSATYIKEVIATRCITKDSDCYD